MIRAFSPITLRFLALAIAVLLIAVSLQVLGALYSGTNQVLEKLQDSRFRLARLEAMRDRPLPPKGAPIPAGIAFQAPDHQTATDLAASMINAAAASVQLTLAGLSTAQADPANPRQIRLVISAEGPEPAILQFINAVERGSPAIRLVNWQITPAESEGGRLKLEATALAAWKGPQ